MIRNNHPKFASTAAVLLGAALLLAGCGNSTTPAQSPAATSAASSSAASSSAVGDGYGAPAPSATASSPAAATTDLKTASTSLGNIVVDSKGMTLYYFTKDAKDTTTSACTGECLAAWPIATTTNATPTVEGVTGKVGTITSPDGAKQLTLNGMPLYYYAADSKPGDVKGQGVKGVWYVASPAGEMIK